MRTLARRTFLPVVAFLCAFIARPAHAQAPEGSDRLSAKAIADSLAVLRRLDDSVRVRPPSATAWFHQGMIAWSLYERARHQPPASGLDWMTLAKMADTSLRRALDLDPDNALYFRAVTQFLVSAGVSFRLYGPYGEFNTSLRNARISGDPARIADAADAAGRMYWLRYDNLLCESIKDWRRVHTLPPPTTEGTRPYPRAPRAVGPFAFLVNWNEDATAGDIDYLKAEYLFREAYEAASDHRLTFRHYAALLADQQRWTQLAALARDKISKAPADAWAWMTLGLATHKLGDATMAAAAFDTALARLEPAERTRLDRIERVLDPREAARLPVKKDSSRAVAERFYWRNADPLWSVEGTEPRLEFYARVTYAELRWTQEELNVNGVNTDYGNTYVRSGSRPMDAGCKPMFQAWYVWNDTTVLRGNGANWARLSRMRVDSIPAQIARFRAGHDSTDVVISALPPVPAITRASSVKGPVRTDFWVITATLKEVARDSVLPTSPEPQRFVHRFAPGGYIYRTEATADGATSAGRATGGFIAGNDGRTGFMLNGAGISDLFLATRVEPRSPAPRRWTDFDVTPLLGPVAAKTQIALLWENYEFGQENGSARYDVVITVKRDLTPTVPGRGATAAPPRRNIGAGIIGSIAPTVRTTRTVDQVEFTFGRTVPHAPVIVENIAMNLGDSPPGNYFITMRIADRVTGGQFGHTQRFTIPAQACRPVLFNPC